MSGICGWIGADRDDAAAVIAAMRARVTWQSDAPECSAVGQGYGLAAVGSPETTGVFLFDGVHVAFHGHARLRNGSLRFAAPADVCRQLASAFRHRGVEALSSLEGDFAVAILDPVRRELTLAIDRIGTRNLVYRQETDALVFAANLDALAAHPSVSQRIDPQSIYNYVYFHMIPGPETVFAGSRRLPAGHCLNARPGSIVEKPYWQMRFEENQRGDERELAREFRRIVETAVEAASSGTACGTFLSGGTDSSTITGFLSRLGSTPVDSFSIGFDASGYDEMSYARIAAQRFGTRHHEYYVTPADVADALPMIAAEYDQPFGNASAVPTYYCAKLAREHGITRMLGGDGGDELFGGNARYARQQVFALYDRIPAGLRHSLIEPIARSALARRLPLVRKGASYVEQARQPMPARYESYNLLERMGPENIFAPDFLSAIDRVQPHSRMAQVWDEAHAGTLINRMLALDLKYTLADNDLPKVTRMCDRAGVDVAFPLLDPSVVDFSAKLAPSLKLRRGQLRYFFKKALQDFLPDEILRKTKHGFGLPAGPWIASDPRLRSLAGDALHSLGKRGIVRADFLDDLVGSRIREHAGYYGTMVWILVMLELWFARHVDPR